MESHETSSDKLYRLAAGLTEKDGPELFKILYGSTQTVPSDKQVFKAASSALPNLEGNLKEICEGLLAGDFAPNEIRILEKNLFRMWPWSGNQLQRRRGKTRSKIKHVVGEGA